MKKPFIRYPRRITKFSLSVLSLAAYILLSNLRCLGQETLQTVTNNGATTNVSLSLESDSVGLSIISPTGGTARNVIQLGYAASSGTGGYIQGTVNNTNDGYGIWINQNAYYDYSKANFVQPRGSLGSYLYTVNYHKGFAWYYAASNGTNGNIIVPVRVASLNAAGTFTTNNITLNANLNLGNTTYSNKNGVIYKNGVPFISDFNYGNNGTVTTAGGNTFIGINAGNFTTGSTATSVYQASYNTALGNAALNHNTTGYENTAVGYGALGYNSTGASNTGFGYEALLNNTTGYYNTAVGYASLSGNTTGINNTATGYAVLCKNTTGKYNTGFGLEALYYNSSGIANTANGYTALFSNTIGTYNLANGYDALYYNTTGNDNAANGSMALDRNTSGSYNTGNGFESLFYNTTGSYNTASGFEGGKYTANGTSANSGSTTSVFIGANTKSLTASDNNEIVIGYNATGAGSNSVVVGNASIVKTLLQGNVGIGTSAPQSKLAVNGTVTATKVKVTQTGWPDYVFDSAYHAPLLSTIESYIKTNHHLPDMPSATTVEGDGLDLGEMQKKQMQKIEELTLYIIQENKMIRKQEQKINKLTELVEQLESQNKTNRK